jgi:hypothetical protein
MKALLFDSPRQSTVSTDAQSDSGGSGYDVGTSRVRAHLMDIAIDIDGGLPAGTAVMRSRDATDVHVGEKRGVVAGCSHGTNTEWRPDKTAVDDRSAGVPLVSPRDLLEGWHLLKAPVFTDA